MKKQKPYLQFPLMLLKEVHEDFENEMNRISIYSVVDFALKQKITIKDAARQVCYDLSRKKEMLNSLFYADLGEAISEKVELLNQKRKEKKEASESVSFEDYFTNDEVREYSNYCMVEILKDDKKLLDAAIMHTQLSKIDSFFNVSGPGPNHRLKVYQQTKNTILKHERNHGEDPRPTIDKDLFFEFWQPVKDASTKDPLLFCAYIAIRSLIGQNSYTRTNKEAIAIRMLGAKTDKVLKGGLPTKVIKINKKIRKSEKSLRYWIDKQIDRLQELDLVKKISWGRGLYLTTSLSYDELALMITKEKKLQEHKLKEKEAIKQIRAAL